MKTLRFAFFLIALSLLGGSSRLHAAGGNTSKVINYSSNVSTVCTSAGTLYEMFIPTGTPGAFTTCVASAAIPTDTLNDNTPFFTVAVVSGTLSSTPGGSMPQSEPKYPLAFSGGLFCAQSASTHRSFLAVQCP